MARRLPRLGRRDARVEQPPDEPLPPPGTDTARAERILEEHFDQKTTGSFSVVVQGERPESAETLVPAVEDAAARAAGELPRGG